MFVLMVAVAPPLLSDQPPEVPRRAGLGDRFHYFRGASGRRYLFSAVRQEDLGDFRSAVVVLARRQASGRLAAYCTMMLDLFGRPATQDRSRLRSIPADAVALVHLLAESERERHQLIEDLMPLPAALAA
jgi:hypothetical protein